MTLPTSGALSIDDILLELGRSSGESISSDDPELYTLSGKNPGDPLIFPTDFYGKSNGIPFESTISLGEDYAGYVYYTLRKYGSNQKGSITPAISNGLKIVGFGEGGGGFPANIKLTGRTMCNELKRMIIEYDGAGSTVSWDFDLANIKNTFLIGISFGNYQARNNESPFNVTLIFSKEYLIGLSFDSANGTGGKVGYDFGSFGSVKFEDVFSNDFNRIKINGNNYSLFGIYSTGSSLTLKLANGTSPPLSKAAFSLLRFGAIYYYNYSTQTGYPATEFELIPNNADSFTSDSTYSTWTWNISSSIESGREYDLVMIK